MIIGIVPVSVLPVTAAETDEGVPSVPSDISFNETYTYDIYIQTVDDADLWNSAYFSIGDGSNDAVKWDIMSDIDDYGDTFSKTYTSDTLFPVMKLETEEMFVSELTVIQFAAKLLLFVPVITIRIFIFIPNLPE